MKIRKAKLKDVNALALFGVKLLKYHEKLDRYFASSKVVLQEYKRFFKSCIYSSKKQFIVAEENDKIIGYVLGYLVKKPAIFKIRDTGYISDMYVESEYRRFGIGRKLLDRMFDWFRKKDISYVEIGVHSKNIIGRGAWKKYGFREFHIKQRIKI